MLRLVPMGIRLIYLRLGIWRLQFKRRRWSSKHYTVRAMSDNTFAIGLLISLYFIQLIYAVAENRFLFGDGVHFFIRILQHVEVYTGGRSLQRLFADSLTQAPVLLAIKAHIWNLQVLSRIYGASLFLPYVICVVVWVWVTKNQRQYILFLFVFLFASSMNSDFYIISESNVAAALYFSLIPLILYRPSWGFGTTLLGVALAAFTLRSYESMLFFGPILAVMAFSRGLTCRSLAARLGWIGLACWFIAGAAFPVSELIYPAQPGISSSTFAREAISLVRVNMLPVSAGFGHLDYEGMLSLIAIILLCIAYAKSAKIETLFPFALCAFGVTCAAVLTLFYLFPGDMDVHLHYYARIFNVAIPALIGLALFIVKSRSIMLGAKYMRQGFKVVFILAIFQLAWHGMADKQWAGYLNVFAKELDSHQGLVRYENSILKEQHIGRQIIANMNWSWTMPEMSIILSKLGIVKTIIANPKNTGWEPFSPLRAKELPKLSRYGITYFPYLSSESIDKSLPTRKR